MDPDISSKIRNRPVLYASEYHKSVNWNILWEHISIIIPAHNEAERISTVIATASAVGAAEVLVVDNNSQDQTSSVAAASGARVVLCEKQGKAEAMRYGVEHSSERSSIILFLDADLTGLTQEHLQSLAAPFFKSGHAEHIMSMGMFDRGKSNKAMWQLPYLTGQRALLKTDFIAATQDIKVTGWEIEATLNAYFKTNKFPILPMVLDGLFHVQKTEKLGKKEGRKARTRMLVIAFIGSVKYPFRMLQKKLNTK